MKEVIQVLDEEIIELFFTRSEEALKELKAKYGKICLQTSYNILDNYFDAEECVNDSYLGVWNAIPPTRPKPLLTYVLSHPLTKEQHYVTAGLGWRFGSTVYLDLAYQYGITERTNYKTFYAVETSNTHSFDPIESIAYNTKTKRHHAVLTLGFRF